jgi:hypothetical protein
MLPGEVVKGLLRVAREYETKDDRHYSTLVSLYTTDASRTATTRAHANALSACMKLHPFGFLLGEIKAGKFQRVETIVYGGNRVVVNPYFWIKDLPDGTYLAVHSPCVAGDSNIPRAAILTAVGLLVSVMGRAVTLSAVGELIIDATDGRVTVEVMNVRLPDSQDKASFRDAGITKEIATALDAVPDQKREEVQFACEVLGRAVHQGDETFRFTLHWVALELIGKTQGDGVAAKLGNAYGVNKTFVYKDLEFEPIYKLRQAITHKGKRALLDARMERVMQCCFVDLMRKRLDLPCKKLTEGYLKGAGPKQA